MARRKKYLHVIGDVSESPQVDIIPQLLGQRMENCARCLHVNKQFYKNNILVKTKQRQRRGVTSYPIAFFSSRDRWRPTFLNFDLRMISHIIKQIIPFHINVIEKRVDFAIHNL